MHEDLKALLRTGWSVGLHFDATNAAYVAVAKKGENVARGRSLIEPVEALARAVIDAQVIDQAVRS